MISSDAPGTGVGGAERLEAGDPVAGLLLDLAESAGERQLARRELAAAGFEHLAGRVVRAHRHDDARLAEQQDRTAGGVVQKGGDAVAAVEQVSILLLEGAIAAQLAVKDANDFGPALEEGGDGEDF